MRVLGIDTSLRSTGIGVVESAGSRYRSVSWEVLKVPASRPVSACLLRVAEGIGDCIAAAAPDAVAIEGAFFCRNARTAMLLGQARGAAIAACARCGVPVYEYAPRRVKQAVVGYGGADKSQVQKMVASMLGLDHLPPDDAADALALAICHLGAFGGVEALRPQPI
jgi:crossover junction endodeoxyribonuclease RuvC